MKGFDGLANTLFVPLAARIAVSREFPEYFHDQKALELERLLPDGAARGAYQYTNMAAAARSLNMDRMVAAFAQRHGNCNVVYLGAGLETAYDWLRASLPDVLWFEADFPEVIKFRREIFGERERERNISCDMFQLEWTREIDAAIPTMLVVSGVFQYFHEEEVIAFIKGCGKALPNSEMVFDATGRGGLKFTNWFIRRTGNANALMHFGVDDSKAFAVKCGMELLEERTFFPDALRMLGKRLNLVSRISMRIAEWKKQALILRLKPGSLISISELPRNLRT